MKQETVLAIVFGIGMFAFIMLMIFIKPFDVSENRCCQQCVEEYKYKEELKTSLLIANDFNEGVDCKQAGEKK